MTVPVPIVVAAVVSMIAVTVLATEATRRYLHWRSRSRQLVAALQQCDDARRHTEKQLRTVTRERNFYRDTAREKGTIRGRLGLTEVRGDPRNGSQGGLHVPGRS